jgi:hypothetical protein
MQHGEREGSYFACTINMLEIRENTQYFVHISSDEEVVRHDVPNDSYGTRDEVNR